MNTDPGIDQSSAVQLARLWERMDRVIDGQQKAEAREEKLDAHLNHTRQWQSDMSTRMAAVEKQLASNEPTIQEFITIKHRVQGAGLAGKWLWAAGGAILAVAAASREHIVSFLMGR